MTGQRTRRHHAADGLDGLSINLLLSGGHHIEVDKGGAAALRAGDLFAYDATRPQSTHGDAYHVVSLYLPRPVVVAAVGEARIDDRLALATLSGSPLAPFLIGQMRLLAEHGATLGPEEFDAALDAATSLAGVLLRRRVLETRADEPREQAGLFTAAQRFIDLHHYRHDLSPDMIAAALGCSRAHLYRVFAAREQTVAAHLRDVRLRVFLRKLAQDPQTGIAELAWSCGFGSDVSDFSRLFKRRFGRTPREARSALLAEGGLRSLETPGRLF